MPMTGPREGLQRRHWRAYPFEHAQRYAVAPGLACPVVGDRHPHFDHRIAERRDRRRRKGGVGRDDRWLPVPRRSRADLSRQAADATPPSLTFASAPICRCPLAHVDERTSMADSHGPGRGVHVTGGGHPSCRSTQVMSRGMASGVVGGLSRSP